MLNKWHDWLGMTKFDKSWHENDMADELREFEEEHSTIKKWSELSDVVYTYTRAQWSGHELSFPLKKWQFYLGIPYMYLKYTGRFLFYRHAGKKVGANKIIRCVRNPQKLYKLNDILVEQNIKVNKKELVNVCQKQLKYWLLLP